MTMLEGTPTFSLLSEKTRDRASLVKMNRSRERARRRSTIDGAINGAINDFLSASEHTKLWDLVDESSMQSHNSVATTGNRYPRRGSVTKFSLDSVLDNNTNFGSLNDNDDNTFIGTFEPNSKLPSFKSEQSCIQVQKRNNNPKEIFTIDQLPIPMKKKKSKKKKEKKKESSNSKINLSTNDLLNGKKKKDGSKRKKRRGSMVHPIDGPFDKPNNNNNNKNNNNNDDDYKPTVVEELPSIGPPSPGILGRRNAVTKTSPGVLGTRNTVTKHYDREMFLEEEIGRQPPSPGILRQQRRNSVTKYSAEMTMP